jgi:ADP-ribose pyrophosphatase YjhB (NUDIX family)
MENEIKEGVHNSLCLYVNNQSLQLFLNDIEKLVLQPDVYNSFHVIVHDDLLPEFLGHIKQRGFKTRGFANGLHYFYTWNLHNLGIEDKVPALATSLQGVGVMVISKNDRVLLMKEKNSNFWKIPTETIDAGESAWDGWKRCLKEELGISNVCDQRVFYVGGWQQRKARPWGACDNFICLAVFVDNEMDIGQLEDFEVQCARWIDFGPLIDLVKETEPFDGRPVEFRGDLYSRNTLHWLAAVKSGRLKKVCMRQDQHGSMFIY